MKKTGIDIIDINGCETTGKIIAIAGTSHSGKTTKLINAMLTSLKEKREILIVSMEDSSNSVLAKMISSYYGIEKSRLKRTHVHNSTVENKLYRDLTIDFFTKFKSQINFLPKILCMDTICTCSIIRYMTQLNIDDIFIDDFNMFTPRIEDSSNTLTTLDVIAKSRNLTIYTTLNLKYSAKGKDIEDISSSDFFNLNSSLLNYFSHIEVIKMYNHGKENIECKFFKCREGYTKKRYEYNKLQLFCSRLGKISEIISDNTTVHLAPVPVSNRSNMPF